MDWKAMRVAWVPCIVPVGLQYSALNESMAGRVGSPLATD